MSLLPQHSKLIEASAISGEVVEARGYRSVETKAELGRLGFGRNQQQVPTLVIPVYDVRGELALYLSRPDQPRVMNGRARKYEFPAGSRMVLDIPPACRGKLGDPTTPIFITEGVRKADSATSRGLCCVSVIGVWNWRGKNELGGKTLLADFESIAFNGRQVYLVFDSDVMTKPEVHMALERFKAVPESRGAKVAVVYLPAGRAGVKVGLDDYFAAGNSVDDLLALASPTLRSLPGGADPGPYEETEQGIVWNNQRHGDVQQVTLTNFTARIVADTTVDDGAEVHRVFEMEGTARGRARTFRVPALQFQSLSWAVEHLGAGAIVEPGQGLKDRTRVAIQTLSGDVPERHVFAHSGWREVEEEWLYLHGGGAIGARGLVPDVSVELPPELAPLTLPAPDGGVAEAVRASLRVAEVARPEIAWPVLAAAWRAPLGRCDFSIHLAGPTGQGKTELAALAQQHFGSGFTARRLPASWHSTTNAIEGIMFAAKDTAVTVDDFAPGGTGVDQQRAHRDADRVYRAVGNQLGRSRMRSDSSLRGAKVPRCLPLGTGEDVPRGQSLQARLLVVHVPPGAVDFEKLTECQRQGADGLYALAMSGFLRWAAPRYGEVRHGLPAEVAELRAKLADDGMHRRTPGVVASLLVGVRYMVDFAVAVEAVSRRGGEELLEAAAEALKAAAAVQQQEQSAADPALRYLALLRAALASGRAHVSSPAGRHPERPELWGWRKVAVGGDGREEQRPQGERIGWLEEGQLYLEPNAALAVVQKLARDGGEALPVGGTVLHRRLHEKDLLVRTELEQRGTFTVRKQMAGERRTVLHMLTESLRGG